MAFCQPTTVTPGTPSLSSGYTARLQRQAVQCDQARLLARLQGGTGECIPQATPGRGAVYASVLEVNAVNRCPPSAKDILAFPKVATLESVRIQNLIQANQLAEINPLNTSTRFSQYVRIVPNPPCVPTQMDTKPKPTFAPVCTPSRFF
jgi:hypothetical protein